MDELKGSSFERGRKFQLILPFNNGDALHTPVTHNNTGREILKQFESHNPRRVSMLKRVHTCSQTEPAGIRCAESAAEEGLAMLGIGRIVVR